jgi:hypothetical protein
MAGKDASNASRAAAEMPREPRRPVRAAPRTLGAVRRRAIVANREKVLAALMDAADPDTPPTENEILGLILGEMAFVHAQGNQPVPPFPLPPRLKGAGKGFPG